MKLSKRSFCPLSSALDFLGDKWSLLIVRDIAFVGKSTFKEFLESDEKIATNILADRLSRLEAQGVVSKRDHPHNKVMKIYHLTQKGLDLLPILLDIVLWSDQYLEITDEGRAIAEEIRKDRQGLLDRLTKELEVTP
ncbi:MAG: helix-turn-helix domain-containing protein [Gammaproteobacteria bacterium]